MPDINALLGGIEGFEWDAGNTAKNVLGHNVSQSEAEEISPAATQTPPPVATPNSSTLSEHKGV